ncbi:unnamed protein product, partial [Brenthis ino]
MGNLYNFAPVLVQTPYKLYICVAATTGMVDWDLNSSHSAVAGFLFLFGVEIKDSALWIPVFLQPWTRRH